MKKFLFLFIVCIFYWKNSEAQFSGYIQFSGLAHSTDANETAVSFATVYDLNSGLLVSANYEGFFSIVVRPGDSIRFSSVGFETRNILIPKTYSQQNLFLTVYLLRESKTLPMVYVYPWGSRDNFDDYFINTPIPDDAYDIARKNLNADSLAVYALNMDIGTVNSRIVLNNYASSYYSFGQIKTYQITNPIAWANFLKLVASGGLKRK